jgi:hypothetical protein
MLLYYITILKVLFMAKGLEQHMLLSISKAIPTGGMWPFIPVAITKFTTKVR